MKLEKRFLLIAILAIALAIPVALAMQHRTHQLKIEKSQNNNLHIQLDKSQKDLQLKSTQVQQLEQQKLDEQKKNEDLQKQLQSKRSSKSNVAAAPAQAPVVAYTGSCEAYRGLLSQYNWNVNTALAVMRAESGCNPSAVSPTCDHGLMQINCVHSAAVGGNLALLNDPATNIKVAYAVYSGAGGWSPWTTFTSGAYLKYL